MGISKDTNVDLLRTLRSKRTTLGLLLVLNACFIFTYIMKNTTGFANEYGTLITNQTSLPPIVYLPAICNGVDTSNVYHVTSVIFSRAHTDFLPKLGRIVVHLRTYTHKNIPKSNGGDSILVWARQMHGDGMVPGNVIDHGNGSYTGFIRVFWIGRTNVFMKLVAAVENTCLRYKALNKYGDIVFTLSTPYGLRAVYRYNDTEVLTSCNTNNFIYGSLHTCDYTDLNGGMSWYCGLPVGGDFLCEDLRAFSLGAFYSRASSENDKIRYPGHGKFNIPLSVFVTNKSTTNAATECNKISPLESWREGFPSGFFFEGHWVLTNCKTSLKHTVGNYQICLRNKTLFFLGDSTLRQYANFFINDILELDTIVDSKFTFGSNFTTYHGHNTYAGNDITIIYRKQAMPLHFAGKEIPVNNIMSFPQIVDSVAKSDIAEETLVLVINYHTHFTSYPPEQYRERIKHLVISLERLFISKPSAKVFFKGPSPCISNSKWWDPYISLVYKKILEEEFGDIKDRVTYLNVWEISVAHNVEDVHPQGKALKSQLHQFMSFMC